MRNKEKSLGINAGLNGLKSVLSVIFPLITYPYVLRVLQVENIGKVDFSNSIVNYFILFAGLGINTYAIREGAVYRNDCDRLSTFSSQMFSINLFSSIVAYIALFVCVLLADKLDGYASIIMIQSLTIAGNLIGVIWLYSIVEDYAYIAIRAMLIHVVALVLMFALVRKQDDYLAYAATSVLANAGANVLNFFHARKYARIRFTLKTDIKKHIRPILFIFASAVASTIYVNSDKTLLGILSDDYHVGLYTASVNIYTILKICMIAIIQVSLPRLSNYVANKRIEEYREAAEYIFKLFLVLLMPIVTGVFLISDEIITIVGGKSYIDASLSLKILSIGLIFSILATFYTNAVLLPHKKEKQVMLATFISAAANVLLNLILLKRFHQDGAAFTTLIAELIMFAYQFWIGRKYCELKIPYRYYIDIVLGCLGIFLAVLFFNWLNAPFVVGVIGKILLSVIIYFGVLCLRKNEMVMAYVNKLRHDE